MGSIYVYYTHVRREGAVSHRCKCNVICKHDICTNGDWNCIVNLLFVHTYKRYKNITSLIPEVNIFRYYTDLTTINISNHPKFCLFLIVCYNANAYGSISFPTNQSFTNIWKPVASHDRISLELCYIASFMFLPLPFVIQRRFLREIETAICIYIVQVRFY